MAGHDLNQKRLGTFVTFDKNEPRVWWCPVCELPVVAVKNPISCDSCDGDVTLAPAKIRKAMGYR